MFGTKEVIELADMVGAIEDVKRLLLNQPDKAAAQLANTLDDLYKIFMALDDEIVRYLGLSFDTEGAAIEARFVLLEMEVGQSRIRMHEASGHCTRIKNIYVKHLNGWFDRVLGNREERYIIQQLFEYFGTANDVTVRAFDAITDWLTQEAEQTLDLVDKNDRNGASDQVRQARLHVRKARLRLTEAMAQLRALQADFISASKTV